ncbi:MAG: hypothetical protein ACPG9K_00940 [Poseidonibacter sp.]
MVDSNVIIKVIEDELERLMGKDSVIHLTSRSSSEYDKGMVAGKIASLQKVLSEVAGKSRNEK